MSIIASNNYINKEELYRASNEYETGSSLKTFSESREKYYRKYILHEQEEETESSLIGKAVDTLILQGEEEFERKFYVFDIKNVPVGKIADFTRILFNETISFMGEDKNIQIPFQRICEIAYSKSELKMPLETVMKKFNGSIYEQYYKMLLEKTEKGFIPLSEKSMERIMNIKEKYESDYTISSVLFPKGVEVRVQEQIKGFYINGIKMQSMLDVLHIDHESKKVRPLDLKCMYNPEDFVNSYFLKRRSYIQSYVYNEACEYFVKTNNLFGYKVEPIKFVVLDSYSMSPALIYEIDRSLFKTFYEGFVSGGKKYPGIFKITNDLKWAKENNIWNISRENYEKGRILKIDLETLSEQTTI